jgi:hypothetical protein
MLVRAALLAFLIAGCVGLNSRVRPWEYKTSSREGYARIAGEDLTPLIRRAEVDFRASPAFPEGRPMALEVLGAARHRDGRMLIAFSMGGASDVAAIYIFDSRGEIIDRYLHSYWGRVRSPRR